MATLKTFVLCCAIHCLALPLYAEQLLGPQNVHLVPTPKELKATGGVLGLDATSRIIAASKELQPLAGVLSGDIEKLTGLKLEIAAGAARSGDIVLAIDPSLTSGEAHHWPYTLAVTDRAAIAGSDYNAVAQGTSTLLQLLANGPQGAALPKLSISDYSAAEFTGMMLDVARQNNTLQDVRDCVELCRLYKVRYFQLHLNDMESVVYPSKLYPKLGTHNRSAHGGPKVVRWTREELLATIKYADERGVALLPELETVFHTGAMMNDMPDEFGGPGVLNMGSEKLYKNLDPLIEEMCDVFKSSPFFQIGCDEASIGGVLGQPGTKDYMAAHNLKTGADLYRFHIDRLAKVIAAKGKRTIVWQDCPLPLDNKEIICMLWHMDFNHGDTANVIKAGYPTIQVTWTPSCGSPVKDLFNWRAFDDQIVPGKLAMGSQLVLWEQNGTVAIPFLRQKMPARQQFTYSPAADLSYPQFAANLAHTDSLLDPLITGFTVAETGLKQSVEQWLLAGGVGNMFDETFVKNVELSMHCNVAGAKVHYTVTQVPSFNKSLLSGPNIGPVPTAESPVASGTIAIEPPTGAAVCVQARAFDADGAPVGGTWTRTYRWQPYAVSVKGTVAEGDSRFGKEATIELTQSQGPGPGGVGNVRYAVNGQVSASSPVFDKPVKVQKSCSISVGYFDAAGKQRGLEWKESFRKVDFDPTNVTYKKPIILWGSSSKQAAEVAVDGIVDRDQYLDIQPAPQEFGIDLEAEKMLNKIVLYTYWDGGRYYQYKIDLSSDGRKWTTVVDASKNHKPATEAGYAHAIPVTAARYIRVTMLRNSANPGLHIVELRAYEAR